MSMLLSENKLSVLLDEIAQQKLPPIAQWDPPLNGHSQMEIKRDGSWWHQGGEIHKLSLIKLFSHILRKEGDKYFLVTPVEKQEITVEDAPFVVTAMQTYQAGSSLPPIIAFTINTGEQFILDKKHPLEIKSGVPYAVVREQLAARLDTSVYYECVAMAQAEEKGANTQWWLYSGEYRALLGEENN